jgi:NADH:ubiquinone oxidoreductase subunit H
MLLMFFLAEYLHLIISAIHFILFFSGGWLGFELLSILPPFFSSYHESLFYESSLLINVQLSVATSITNLIYSTFQNKLYVYYIINTIVVPIDHLLDWFTFLL